MNKDEMIDEPLSRFLVELNGIDWDSNIATLVHAVVSYYGGGKGDGVVSRESQDMRAIRRYERNPYLSSSELPFDPLGEGSEILHTRVVNEPTVIAVVQSEIEKVDRTPMNIAGTWHFSLGRGSVVSGNPSCFTDISEDSMMMKVEQQGIAISSQLRIWDGRRKDTLVDCEALRASLER